MNTDTRATHAALVAGAALLDQGRRLNDLSRLFTFAALLMASLALVLSGRSALWFAALAALAVVAGLIELWFAARVDLDAQLFRHLAEEARAGRLDLGSFDIGMHRAGLIPAPPVARGLDVRLAGARRLLTLQLAACMAQILLMAGAGVVAWVRP